MLLFQLRVRLVSQEMDTNGINDWKIFFYNFRLWMIYIEYGKHLHTRVHLSRLGKGLQYRQYQSII